MAIEAPPRTHLHTLDDLVARLGDIPLSRIWMDPPPGTATKQDVIDADALYDRLCELVDGTLVEKPMGHLESRIAMRLGFLFESYMETNDLGIVAGEAGMMELEVDLVRIPDVSVVLWASLPVGGPPDDPIPAIAPDLAVEVLSKSNTRAEIRRKLREYFDAGCKLAWVIEPKDRTAEVYHSADSLVKLTDADALAGEDVLPEFSVSLKELFDVATRKRPRYVRTLPAS